MPDPNDPTGTRPAVAHGPATSPPGPPPPQPEIDATLARLEQSSRDVQTYLDTIEQKIARLEPHVERLHQTAAPAPPEAPFAPPEPASDPPQNPAESPGPPPPPDRTQRRRRSDHGPLAWAQTPRTPLPSPAARLTGTPRSPVTPGSWRLWLLVAFSLVFLSAGIAWIIRAHHPAPALTTEASLPTLGPDTAPTPALAKPSAGNAAPLPARDISDPTAANSAPPGNTLPNPSPVDESTPSPDATGAAADSPTTPAASEPAAAAHTGFAPSSRPSLPTGVTAISPGKVRVSSGVMAGNLLYSRAPEAPGGLARLFHLEGRVTMQVVISPTGRVQNIRILSGHRLLRGPARDAVSTWRYRPLLVNGTPVEVATIVSIDFRR